jgi:hypothetical protein
MWFLYVEWQTRRVPDTHPKPDGYGYRYEFLLAGTGTNFYQQYLCWWTGNCSTWPESDPLLSLITAHLPLYRSRGALLHQPWTLSVCVRNLQKFTTVKKDTYTLNTQIMSYILNIFICVGMILLDILSQCFIYIHVINLSSTFNNTVIIYIIYF